MPRPQTNPRKLIESLPHFMRGVEDYKQIMEAEQPEFDRLYSHMIQASNNTYIKDADEAGLTRLEKLYGITPPSDADLEARRYTLLTVANEGPPYTLSALHRKLTALCGPGNYELHLDPEKFELQVLVGLEAKHEQAAVDRLLNETAPANLVKKVSLRYNPHSYVARISHRGLATKTHHQIRTEILDDLVAERITHDELRPYKHDDIGKETHDEVHLAQKSEET